MTSDNPILKSEVIVNAPSSVGAPMTVQGAVQKTGILLSVVSIMASVGWSRFKGGHSDGVFWMIAGLVVGLIAAIATSFKPEWSPVSAPIYAAAEGLFLGGVSATIDMRFPGIALQAVMLTFGTLFGLLGAYRMGWIRATEKFRAMVVAGTMAVALVYLVTMVLGLFGVQVPFIHSGGTIGILFSLVVVGLAAMNLVLDFDFIEQAADAQAPRYMEWYAAFGLMVTLVWLYMEILKLLVKLADRR